MTIPEVHPAERRIGLSKLLRTILVPTDLTAVGNYALRFAMDLAQQAKSRVIVATVVGQAAGDVYSPIRYSPEAAVQHETAVEMLRDQIAALVDSEPRDGVDVEMVVRRGRTNPTIIRLAESERVDLIVMGTHARKGLSHLILGSSAEDLVRAAPCSVLTLHGNEPRAPSDIRRILVPIDFSEYSIGVLDFALRFARDIDADVDVLHVVEPIPMLDAFSGIITMNDVVPALRRRSAVELEKLLEKVDDVAVAVRLHVEEGHPASKILEFAEDHTADLIAIGTRGISAVERFFIGGVAERIVQHATCPVLATRLAVERV